MRFFTLFGISVGLVGLVSIAQAFELPGSGLIQKAVDHATQKVEDKMNTKTAATTETKSDNSIAKDSAPEAKPDSSLHAVAKAGDETKWKSVLKEHPDFKLVEKGYSGKLEKTNFVDIKIQQGAYYAFRVRLAPGSSWRVQPNLGIPGLPEPGREPTLTTVGTQHWGPSEAIFELGPVKQSAQISVAPVYSMMSEDGTNLGNGSYIMEVYKRTGSNAERHKDEVALAQYREQDAKERSSLRKKTCSLCAEELTQREKKICLERRGNTMSDCGW